ncbi:DUF3606 domain-containing protein [Luteibacter sp.]|uniref:DUF3606 domain-containing protein n=1 Tax=Luteibacter sp. TaxID=1886636 RepID=UPI003F80A4FD
MAAGTHKRSKTREQIDLTRRDDVRYWMKALGISEQTLTAAVKRVGNSSADVLSELRRRKSNCR